MANLPDDKRSFTLTIPKDVFRQAEKIAKEDRRSVTFVLNELILIGLKNYPISKNRADEWANKQFQA